MERIKIEKNCSDSFNVWTDDAEVQSFHKSDMKDMVRFIIDKIKKLKSPQHPKPKFKAI